MIELHSSAPAKRFYQLSEPIHGLITDLGLIHQHLFECFRHIYFHHSRHRSPWQVPFVSIRDFLQIYHFCLFCKVARNSLRHLLQIFVADELYLSPTFLAVQIRCPKHTKWRHHHFGESVTSLFVSLMVSTTRGLELIIVLTSVDKVFRDSSSKLLL